MLVWLSNLISASSAEQVIVIEERAPSFEDRLEQIVSQSRGLKNKNPEELTEFINDVETALSILEKAIDLIDRPELEFRANRVRTRLRKSRTRAINQRSIG